MYEFERYDLSRVDYVFTTVPLQTATAVPIYQIGNFLDASDVPQVRRQLELGSVNFLKDYYRPICSSRMCRETHGRKSSGRCVS